jgi:hypothetical protein
VSNGDGRLGRITSAHPFSKREPKPTRARLVGLLGPLGRKRYGEVERFLATINGASSGLHYYCNNWGWAVRYLLGAKNALCTLHLLPDTFEATVMLGRERDHLVTTGMAPDLKRRVARGLLQGGLKCVRVPIKNDHDYDCFQTLINVRAAALRAKKAGKTAGAPVAEKALAG